jgi:hypothetical protein
LKKEYLKNISKELKNYSRSLDKTSILINKPWAVIDEEFQLQKLIFKKDKTLIMSRNGKVTEGRWDYFSEAKSLLIDRGDDKILCNEVFINEGIIILKLDGTQKEVFALANENLVPDLNIKAYIDNWLQENRHLLTQSEGSTEVEQIRNNKESILDDPFVMLFLIVIALVILVALLWE